MADVDLKPAPKLSGPQLEQVTEAIVDGFDLGELTIALKFKWGLTLANYVNTAQGYYGVVAELISWTERRGKTPELMALAYAERPRNPAVRQAANALGLALSDASEKYDLARPLPPKPPLEALVVRHSRFVDYGKFLDRFGSIGDRVCRIETPSTLGTGFLVGPNHVLTNFHVVESLEKTPAYVAQTVCRFDYRREVDADTSEKPRSENKNSAPTTSRLDGEWLLAKSRYSESDVTGGGEARSDELDYALLQLAESVGNQCASDGKNRGWFSLTGERPLLAVRDFVVVPQHAQGRTLEVAWGGVLDFNGLGTRVRYDTSTEAGSSGSPCFSVDLELFGLHHATDPIQKPKFNQAIPLDLIASDLKAKGKSP